MTQSPSIKCKLGCALMALSGAVLATPFTWIIAHNVRATIDYTTLDAIRAHQANVTGDAGWVLLLMWAAGVMSVAMACIEYRIARYGR